MCINRATPYICLLSFNNVSHFFFFCTIYIRLANNFLDSERSLKLLRSNNDLRAFFFVVVVVAIKHNVSSWRMEQINILILFLCIIFDFLFCCSSVEINRAQETWLFFFLPNRYISPVFMRYSVNFRAVYSNMKCSNF